MLAPSAKFDDLTALILDGGRGRRLSGRHKAFLEVGGRPIATRTLELLSGLTSEILVATNRPLPWRGMPVRCIADPVEDAGPLAGLVAGLEAAGRPLVLALGADMPLVSESVVRDLVERARLLPGRAIVPVHEGRAQVLHAIYPKAFAPAARAALLSGTRRLTRLLEATNVVWVEAEELAGLPGASDSFRDIDTPADLEGARRS